MLYEDILCISSVNPYDKIYTRICIPPDLVKDTLEQAHLFTGHGGIRKMMEHLKSFVWWRFLARDTKKFCKNCHICNQNKIYISHRIPVLEHPKVTRPWSRCHIDLVGPLPQSHKGNKYILTVVDAFSRFSLATPLPDKRMVTVARAMVNDVFSILGCPDVLYSDRGLEFTGRDFKDMCRKLGILQSFTTSFNPSSNGCAERHNRTLVEILRCLCHEQPNTWDESLKLATLAFNSSFCQAVNETPHFIFFLRDPKLPYKELLQTNSGKSSTAQESVTDYISELSQRATTVFKLCKLYNDNQMIKRNDKLNADRKFKDITVEDRVYLKNNIRIHKFTPRYVGPYRVLWIKGNTVFCYSLASKKHRSVSMDKVRFAGDLTQEDAPNILDSFPIEEPSYEEECLGGAKPPIDSSSAEQPAAAAAALTTDPVSKRSRVKSMNKQEHLQPRHNLGGNNRYNLRSR